MGTTMVTTLLFCITLFICCVTLNSGSDVIKWKEDFEEYDVGSQWSVALDHKELTTMKNIKNANNVITKALEVKYLKGKFGGESRVRYKQKLKKADRYSAEFDVMFRTGFDFSKGGKLPGVCGGKCTTGCKAIDPEGWSSRFMWKRNGAIILYLYHQDRQHHCGDVYKLKYNAKPGQWIRLRQEVRINSPNNRDGMIKIWINDKLVFDHGCLRLRGNTTKAQIDLFYFTTFYGGSTRDWSPIHDTYAYFDNFNVTRI